LKAVVFLHVHTGIHHFPRHIPTGLPYDFGNINYSSHRGYANLHCTSLERESFNLIFELITAKSNAKVSRKSSGFKAFVFLHDHSDQPHFTCFKIKIISYKIKSNLNQNSNLINKNVFTVGR